MADSEQVVLEGVAYDEFVVPNCRECQEGGKINSVVREQWDTIGIFTDPYSSKLKPDLVFFGESIHDSIKDRSYGPSLSRSAHGLIRTHQTGSRISKTATDYL